MPPPRIDPGRWPEIDRLLDTLLDLPAADRAGWLASLGSTLDPSVRDLLSRAAAVETSDFLEAGPRLQAIQDPERGMPGFEVAPGDTVGGYRLLQELGSGGMATVWLAERADGLIQRPVAVKLPHGVWRGAGLVERMAREREILAALDHPNIAHLYDAGVTADGRPFLALEYVEGRAIDVWCRENRLDGRAVLELFAQTARAVAYAHGKLALHRDLKPANILVTGQGQVKLLDFGIAKLLEHGQTRGTGITQASGRALTLDYASPEQIRGEPLTIASDVYSLGVLLHELLSGARPYRLKRDSPAALEEAILQAEPSRPSDVAPPALRKLLRGDLDAVVLKALKKHPEHRYATVPALLDDIERYLAARPVLAQPDGHWYRARKFVARHAVAVGAATAVVIAVVAGAGAAVWQARIALAEKSRAEEVKEFVASIFREADPYQEAGRALTGVELLNNARAQIRERFDDRPDIRLELLGTVGASLTNLGDLTAAQAVLQEAVADARRLHGERHPATLRQRALLAEVHGARRDIATVQRETAELLPLARMQVREDPETLVRLLKLEADLAFLEGRFGDSAAPATEAFELAVQALGRRHPLTVTLSSLFAEAVVATGPPDAALAATERGLSFALAAYGGRSEHPHVIYMRELRARALGVAGRFREAIAELEAVIVAADAAFGPRSSAAAYAMSSLGPYARRVGAIDDSIAYFDAALDVYAERIDPASADWAFVLLGRGVTYLAARRPAAAFADLAGSERVLGKVFGEDHWDTRAVRFEKAIALAYLGRHEEADLALAELDDPTFVPGVPAWAAYVQGVVARLGGDYERAATKLRDAERLNRLDGSPRAVWERARILGQLGLAERERGAVDVARATLLEARALFSDLAVEMHPGYADVLLGLARLDMHARAFEQALPLLEQVHAFWQVFDPANPFAGEAALWLGRCRAALGSTEEVAAASMSRKAARN